MRSAVQLGALGAATLAALVGVLGFVPGATSGHLAFAGLGSHAQLFGTFRTSVLQNLLSLAFTVAAVVLARTREGARTALLVGGVGLLVLWLLSAIGHGGWLPTNRATDWLHLAGGALFLGLGFVTSRDVADAAV